MHKDYDNILHIKTTNRGKRADKSLHYNQYEATPYPTLHTLFKEYELAKTDHFVDFGSGKGRLIFYVHNRFRSAVTGVEMDEQLYQKTLQNKASYMERTTCHLQEIKVLSCLAEKYVVQAVNNVFYFFNPFSIQIFMDVISNILRSVQQHPRKVDIILYYPSNVYSHYLNTETPFKLVKEVLIPGLYNINKRECFLIFRYEG